MDEDLFYGMAAVLVVLFVGLTVLVPVLAVTLRLALRPVLETWMQVRQSQAADTQQTLLERRMNLLETEVQQIQHALQTVLEAQEFQRQLSEPGGDAR